MNFVIFLILLILCGFILVNTLYYLLTTINNVFFGDQRVHIHRGDIFTAFDPSCYYDD